MGYKASSSSFKNRCVAQDGEVACPSSEFDAENLSTIVSPLTGIVILDNTSRLLKMITSGGLLTS